MTLLATSAPVFADTLASGSVYFDSQKTLEEVFKLSAEKDNESILKLIKNGQISQRTDSAQEVIVLAVGSTPESPAEFRFLSGPPNYWTLTKFVTREVAEVETAEPAPTPPAERAPTPKRSLTPTVKPRHRGAEKNDPFDDYNGQRIWHKVDGKWKWYPVYKEPVKPSAPQ